MKIQDLDLEGVKLVYPQVFRDKRGFFLEIFNKSQYEEAGIKIDFPQDNLSYSKYGTIRGMHFQTDPGQAKLVKVIKGRIYDVFVDIRKNSKTFGNWRGIYLSEDEHQQLFIPVGFAHGFCCVSDDAYVMYKVSSQYDPYAEKVFRYDDKEVGIKWPVVNPILSDRDLSAPFFSDVFDQVIL